jgi:hypothetical protein
MLSESTLAAAYIRGCNLQVPVSSANLGAMPKKMLNYTLEINGVEACFPGLGLSQQYPFMDPCYTALPVPSVGTTTLAVRATTYDDVDGVSREWSPTLYLNVSANDRYTLLLGGSEDKLFTRLSAVRDALDASNSTTTGALRVVNNLASAQGTIVGVHLTLYRAGMAPIFISFPPLDEGAVSAYLQYPLAPQMALLVNATFASNQTSFLVHNFTHTCQLPTGPSTLFLSGVLFKGQLHNKDLRICSDAGYCQPGIDPTPPPSSRHRHSRIALSVPSFAAVIAGSVLGALVLGVVATWLVIIATRRSASYEPLQ